MVYRPEYIRAVDAHYLLKAESDEYGSMTVPSDVALLYHMRRVKTSDPDWSDFNVSRSQIFQRFIEPCNESWRKRLITIAEIPGTEILRAKKWNREKRVCHLSELNAK
ncbi:unnamed protein product [Gongylonema pulchrum]|uniref:Glycosyltransferase family 92 protein n=1 Tax=Gongylonema pulchrum TaxID=637853 RepID=A0A183CV17_9BILA|nr:unnamed protein product [Gongylonema pulchrum]